MAFEIPMNTSAPMSLADIMGGGAPQQQNNMGGMQQPMQQAPMNNGYNQQPMGQPMQNNYGQPQQNFNQQPMQQQPMQSQYIQQAHIQRPSGDGVHLKKGSKTAIVGVNGQQLTSIRIGLGWDVINQECDLDASAFMLGADGRVIGDDWFVFYGQPTSPDNSIRHSGDSKGQGVGDDETIDINLMAINPNVKKITFVVTINEALERGLNFSMVQNAYIRVMSGTTGQELMRFNLTDYYSNVTAMVVGEVYNHNGQWKLNAVGNGVAKDLAGLCAMYGVNVAD